MTLLEPEVVEEQKLDDGDHERFTHVVVPMKGDKRSPEAIVTEARVMGTPIRALCGKEWVPSHDESKYPVCPTCIELWEAWRNKPWPGRR